MIGRRPARAAPRRAVTIVVSLVVCGALVAAGCSDGGDGRGATSSTTTVTTTTTRPDRGHVPSSSPEAAGTAPLPAVEPEGTTVDATLHTPDGRDRTYRVYVPTGVDVAARTGGDSVPLLVALHGGTGTGTQFEKSSGFDGIAEANRFLVVYPDGVGSGPDGTANRTWNGGRCCGVAARDGVDDVAFIGLLVEALSGKYPVDPGRVFVAGHSNGGVLAYRLACELADVVVAIGVQSTSLEIDRCDPARPVSVLHIHGTADQNIPIGGGTGPQAISGVSFGVPIDGARTVAAADGCPAEPVPSADPSNPDLTIDRWNPCADGTEVRFVTVAGAPHAWMGPQRPGTRPGAERYTGLDASAEIWAFLTTHERT